MNIKIQEIKEKYAVDAILSSKEILDLRRKVRNSSAYKEAYKKALDKWNASGKKGLFESPKLEDFMSPEERKNYMATK